MADGDAVAQVRTCFISSPAGTDLTNLRSALTRRGVRVVVPDDLSPGANWSESILRKMRDVDLVIGVLTTERRSQWVLFELGQAAALGRQIVLIAPPKLSVVPAHLKHFLIIRASLKNREAIDFALDQILASPGRTELPPTNVPRLEQALGSEADTLISQLRSAITSSEYHSVEQIVIRALRGSGAEIVAEAPDPDLGADIAVWSDDLQSYVGNPLLVEVKARFRGFEDLRHAAQQLFAAVTSRGGSWGLLLYGLGPPNLRLGEKGLPPTILIYSISEFIEQLRARSFADVIRGMRNRRVHGEER